MKMNMKLEQTKVFQTWFDDLPDNIQIKVKTYINRVMEGNTSDCRPVGEGITEIKIFFQKGYRVYYTIINRKIVLLLLCGGHKDSQENDIKRAKKIKKLLEA